MKRLILIITLLLTSVTAMAETFWWNGVLYGTVCRSGLYYTVYPREMAQPVGTACPVRDAWGNVIMQGVVTNE